MASPGPPPSGTWYAAPVRGNVPLKAGRVHFSLGGPMSYQSARNSHTKQRLPTHVPPVHGSADSGATRRPHWTQE